MFNILKNTYFDIRIQYFDNDHISLIKENNIRSVLHCSDRDNFLIMNIHNMNYYFFKLPPFYEIWTLQIDGSYQLCWSVHRIKAAHSNIRYEWWEWMPQIL